MTLLDLLKEEKSQASMEYLYLTAFAVGIVAIIALLMNDIVAIQKRSKNKIAYYRELLFRIITD